MPLTDHVFLYRSTEKGIFSNDVRLFLTSLSLVVGCWVIESLVASHGVLVPASSSFTRRIIVAFAMLEPRIPTVLPGLRSLACAVLTCIIWHADGIAPQVWTNLLGLIAGIASWRSGWEATALHPPVSGSDVVPPPVQPTDEKLAPYLEDPLKDVIEAPSLDEM